MKGIHFQIGVTLDADAVSTLVELLQQVVEKATAQNMQARPTAAAISEPSLKPNQMTPIERSQHAMSRGQKPPDNVGLLVNMREAAKLLKMSERNVWSMWKAGKIPRPIRIGQSVRWGYEELRAWVNAGGPPLDQWTWTREERE